jgi:hypothetical protein
VNVGVLTVLFNNTTLADGTDSGGRAILLDGDGGGVFQVAEFFRGLTIGLFSRGNIRDQLGIRVQQFQADMPTALARYFSEPTTIPSVAQWTISYLDPSGATITATTYAGAKVQRKQPTGRFTDFTYKLTAQDFSVTTTGGTTPFVFDANYPGADYILDGGSATFTPADIYDFTPTP